MPLNTVNSGLAGSHCTKCTKEQHTAALDALQALQEGDARPAMKFLRALVSER